MNVEVLRVDCDTLSDWTIDELGSTVFTQLRQGVMNAQGNPVRLLVSTDPVLFEPPQGLSAEELKLVIECVHRRIVTLNLGAEQFGADSAEKDIRRRDSAVLQAIKAKLEQGASDGGERQG